MSEPYDPLSYGVVRLGSGQESGKPAAADSPEEMLFGPQDAPAAIAGQDEGSDWDALPDAPLGGACSASAPSLDIEPADLVGPPPSARGTGRKATTTPPASLEDALFGAAPRPAAGAPAPQPVSRSRTPEPSPTANPAASPAKAPGSKKAGSKKTGKSLPTTRSAAAAKTRTPQPPVEAAAAGASPAAPEVATPSPAPAPARGPARPAASAPRRELRPSAARSVEASLPDSEPLIAPRAGRSRGTATTVAVVTALLGIGLGAWQYQAGELVLAGVAAALGVLGGALSFVVLRR